MKRQRIFIIAAILCLAALPLAASEVVIFDTYDTSMTYESGQLHVVKQLRIKNVGPNPIIPGEIHFKISYEKKGEILAPVIENFQVKNKYGQTLETRNVATAQETDLVFTIWDPLLPDFFYDMTMTYDLPFDPKGVLFYQVVLPEERTTIPIKTTTTTFNLPKRYHVTYLAPDGDVKAEKEVNTVTWNVKDAYQVEYSLVPFPRLGFKAVNTFWILVIILFLINLVFRLRKRARLEGSA